MPGEGVVAVKKQKLGHNFQYIMRKASAEIVSSRDMAAEQVRECGRAHVLA